MGIIVKKKVLRKAYRMLRSGIKIVARAASLPDAKDQQSKPVEDPFHYARLRVRNCRQRQ